MREKKVTFCQHCKEVGEVEECEICKKPLIGICLDCHMELVHNEICNQNINFFDGCGLNCLSEGQYQKLNEMLYPWIVGE